MHINWLNIISYIQNAQQKDDTHFGTESWLLDGFPPELSDYGVELSMLRESEYAIMRSYTGAE